MVSMLQGVWRCTHLPGPRFCTESGQQKLRFAGPEMETEPTGGTHRQKRAEEHRDIWGLSGNRAWDRSRDLTPSAPSESHTDALSAGHRGPPQETLTLLPHAPSPTPARPRLAALQWAPGLRCSSNNISSFSSGTFINTNSSLNN